MGHWAASGAALVFIGCYGHIPTVDGLPAKVRPAFVRPGTGTYRIEHEGRPVGEETFSIEAADGAWRTEGRVRWNDALARTEGYWLEFDASRAEPRALRLFLELVGERRSVEAQIRAGFLEATGSGPGGALRRSVPYAPGTNVEFASPLFKAPVLSLLGPDLVPGDPVFVRTIVFTLPKLTARVELVRLQLQEERNRQRLVVLERRGEKAPTALWVRPDGLVTRMRTWPKGPGGPRLEWHLTRWTPAHSEP